MTTRQPPSNLAALLTELPYGGAGVTFILRDAQRTPWRVQRVDLDRYHATSARGVVSGTASEVIAVMEAE